MQKLGIGKAILGILPKPGFPRLKVLLVLGLCQKADPVSLHSIMWTKG